MKKFILLSFVAFLCTFSAQAESIKYLEEVRALGAVAGQGLACEASKYHTFELLARAILISKASSDAEQSEGMKAYNEYKANAFISKMQDGFANCESINDSFNKQSIFKSTLYGDGTIKMPDGLIITPRHPYDATLVYKKDFDARQKYIDLYKTRTEKIYNDPTFQKALRQRQMQDGL